VPLPFERRGRHGLDNIERELYRMIDERTQAGGDDRDDRDLLEALIGASADGSRFDRQELRDHAINLMFAGHETTAATLVWALVLLEQHPQWTERAIAEIESHVGSRPPTYDDMQRLEVTRACWEEALRIAPPGVVAPRSAATDAVLGSYRVPAGRIVLINYVAIQSHPDFWHEPAVYNPGRFLGPEAGPRRQRAQMPYGLGPRACVGALMGQMEGMFTIIRLLQRYRLTVVPGGSLRTTMRGTIHYKDGPRMLVHRRLHEVAA
jgi:cytochrome P450